MIFIADERLSKRSRDLRDRFRRAGISAAAGVFGDTFYIENSPLTVIFAKNDDRVEQTALISNGKVLVAVNASGGHLFSKAAHIWDGRANEALVRFVLRLAAAENNMPDPFDLRAGTVRVTPEGAYVGARSLALTMTERLVMYHLTANAGRFCTQRELRKFAFSADDLRRRKRSVSVLVCRINKKAVAATGEKVIECRRKSGYALICALAEERRTDDRPGAVPVFR